MGFLQAYLGRGEVYALLRPFFLLPFVPVDEIIPCFLRCKRELCKCFLFNLKTFLYDFSEPETGAR